MKKLITALVLTLGVTTTAQAAPYEIYSKPRQCYGFYADSKEKFSVKLITQIIDKHLSKGDLIKTAVQFKLLPVKRKLKVAFMCKGRYSN